MYNFCQSPCKKITNISHIWTGMLQVVLHHIYFALLVSITCSLMCFKSSLVLDAHLGPLKSIVALLSFKLWCLGRLRLSLVMSLIHKAEESSPECWRLHWNPLSSDAKCGFASLFRSESSTTWLPVFSNRKDPSRPGFSY